MFFGALTLLTVNFVGCKDYDDDIDNLQAQIDNLETTVSEIQSAIGNGYYIKDVQSGNDGITLSLSNGKTYSITNGQDGAAGKAGSVVTIGENGNWFIDNVDTGKPSKGSKGDQGDQGAKGDKGDQGAQGDKGDKGDKGDQGAQGPQGPQGNPGVQGPQGASGKYYYPGTEGAENGFWVEVAGDGTKTVTTNKWLPEGTITAVWENGSVTLHNVQGIAGGKVTVGSVLISYLTLIPDFVGDQAGALPVLNFSPLKTANCGEIAPSVTARYRVSPSNATADMIDKENLSFEYNNPSLRSAAINPKAEFVSLENGILTVKVSVNTAMLDDVAVTGKIDQLMLTVPLKSGGSVNSDWAKIDSEPFDNIALVRKPLPAGQTWPSMELAKTIVAAKAINTTTNPTVVNLAYDGEIDLMEVVKTMLTGSSWTDFDIETYGLSYSFDLKDETGATIVYEVGTNKTDQQKFLNLVGSKVTTRVYDLDGANPASVDRTPIVHVTLKTAGGCIALHGFIKINIVEATVDPVDPIEIDGGTIEAKCADYTKVLGTQQMNEEFYAKVGLSKTDFHNYFTWAELTGGVGTIVERADPNDTESYNLVWTVTEAQQWANLGKTIEKSGTYTYGNNVIKVTFKVKVTQPEFDMAPYLLTNYWDAAKTYIIHNVAVPEIGATNPADCTFETNINNAFSTNANALLNLPTGYTYEYVFDIAANQPVKSYNGITVSVSADGKTLNASRGGVTETVATINPQLVGTGDVLAYNENSSLGKELLNGGAEFMKARVKVIISNACGKAVSVKGLGFKDAFDVHFLRPVNVDPQSAENFVDGVDFGATGSWIDVQKAVQLSDWRNYAKNITDYNFEPNHLNYYDYYDVSAITIDVNAIKPIGLIVNGSELAKLPITMEVQQTATDPSHPFGTLTYKNNGANLTAPFKMELPVTVTYKWGEVTTKVTVDVKTTASVRSGK